MAYQLPPIDKLTQVAEILVKSGFYRNSVTNVDQALAKMLYGMELGLTPVQCLTGVYVLKNRDGVILSQPTLTAASMHCLIQKGGYKLKTKVFSPDKSVIEVIDRDGSVRREAVFTMEDARRAQLLGNQQYQKVPQNMLLSRNVANIARQDCSDIFGGPVYTPEEMGADVDDEGVPIQEDDGSFRLTMRESANEELRLRGEPPMPPKEQKQKAADKPKPATTAANGANASSAKEPPATTQDANVGTATTAEPTTQAPVAATDNTEATPNPPPASNRPGPTVMAEILQAGATAGKDKAATNTYLCEWLTKHGFDLKTFQTVWTTETVEQIKADLTAGK